MDKIILIDKPAGISSFGVVARVRRVLSEQATAVYNAEHPDAPLKRQKIKVGHTGTLDPFATGLLILLAGTATKRSNEFLKKDKVYEAEITLGATSTTGDPEGEITTHQILTPPTLNEVETTVMSFKGEITQKVPAFSAVKINGQRAYQLARAGKTPDTPERPATIFDIEILDYDFPKLEIRAHVSSGTYIRTLSEDIGLKLGTGAYTSALRRLKIGDYDVADAVTLEEWMDAGADS